MEPWLETFSGTKINILDPRPEDFRVGDIAHALAHTCRYNGHSKGFYSVAQHSVIVSRCCSLSVAKWGLLHDAAEAYLSDVPAPLKQFLYDYKKFESLFEERIAKAFGLRMPVPKEVKKLDLGMLKIEHRDVIQCQNNSWEVDLMPLSEPLKSIVILDLWTPQKAEKEFLDRFVSLFDPGKIMF